MKEDLVLGRPPKHTEGLKTGVILPRLCSSHLCALGELQPRSRADSGESLVAAAVQTVLSQLLPCSAVTRGFNRKQSWWLVSTAALLREPCSLHLRLGMPSSTCCVDVTATLSHVPGDVAEAHFLGHARDCTKLVSPRTLDFLSTPTVPEERQTHTVVVLEVKSKMATCSLRVPEGRCRTQDGPVTWRNGAGGGGKIQVQSAERVRVLCPVRWSLRLAFPRRFLGLGSVTSPPFCLHRAFLSLRDSLHLTSTPPVSSWMAPAFSSSENSQNMRSMDRWAGEDHGHGLVQGG